MIWCHVLQLAVLIHHPAAGKEAVPKPQGALHDPLGRPLAGREGEKYTEGAPCCFGSQACVTCDLAALWAACIYLTRDVAPSPACVWPEQGVATVPTLARSTSSGRAKGAGPITTWPPSGCTPGALKMARLRRSTSSCTCCWPSRRPARVRQSSSGGSGSSSSAPWGAHGGYRGSL